MFTITIQQIREGLRDAKFLFLSVIILIAFGINGVVYSERYALAQNDYEDSIRSATEALETQADSLQRLSSYPQVMMKQPAALAFVRDGGEERLPNAMEVNAFLYRRPQHLSRGNEMLATLPALDWSFIIGTLMTLAALLVSYGAICGEKRDGTLKLLLSYPVSRRTLFTGKFFGLLAVTSIVLGLGILTNLTVILLLGEIPLKPELLMVLGWVLLLAFLLVAFMVLAGMAVSAMTARPAVSLVILLVFWVIAVAAVPGITRLVAEQVSPVKSKFETDREMEIAIEDVGKKHPDEAGNWNGDPFASNIPLRRDWVLDQVNTQQRFEDAALDTLMRQAETTRNLASLSPVGLFNSCCEVLCNTGVAAVRTLQDTARRYKEQLYRFTVERDKKDPDTPHLVYSWGTSCDNGTFSTKPVELGSVPRSQALWGVGGLPQEESSPLAAVAILTLLTVLVAGIAFIAVSRYDPR